MNQLPTEYEYTKALFDADGHVRTYPGDTSHVDHIQGYGTRFSISTACQADIDKMVDEWLVNDLPTLNIRVETLSGNEHHFLMFQKHVVNFCDCSNRVEQYVMARATDHAYKKIHSRYLGGVEYMEIQHDGVGLIHNYVTNMDFSTEMGERKHSSFLTQTPIPEYKEKQEVYE